MDLTTDSLKLEQELERVINSDQEIQYKTESIKSLLSRMVTIEASLIKFTSMMNNNNNNNDLKQNQND